MNSVRISTLSSLISVASAAATSADAHANTASAAASAASAAVSTLSLALSVAAKQASVASAAATSADAHANTASAAASAASVAVSVLSVALSVSDAKNSNAISVLSQAVSVLSQSVSVLSQSVSVLSVAVAGPTTRVLSTIQTISATTLTNISGLSATLLAGGVYQLQAFLFANIGAAAQTYGYGMTFPAMARTRGNIYATTSTIQGGIPTLSTIGLMANWDGDSASGSVILSTISVAYLSGFVVYGGLFVVSTQGTLQLQAKASTGTTAIQFLPGSYMQVFRIA